MLTRKKIVKWAATNKQFGKSTAEVLNSTFGILSTFVVNLNRRFPISCLRQAAGRCRQANQKKSA
jgi:hypothetical protein